MFSPYYERARAAAGRRKRLADPLDHVAINVALYGVGGPGWAMTERRAGRLQQHPLQLRIGPSALHWHGGALRITLDELTVPLPRRLRGVITLHPAAVLGRTYPIDGAGRHRWTPLAPCAQVDVAFDSPGWRWSGHGYGDSNEGDVPLEADFRGWEWSRAMLPDGSSVVLYDADRLDGSRLALARRWYRDGRSEPIEMPQRHPLPRGLWGMTRTTHGDPGTAPVLLRALEDSPFYTRSLVQTRLMGQPVTALHESLSLNRFSRRWVQVLLPFRMPRNILAATRRVAT